MSTKFKLVRVDVHRDKNEFGEMAWFAVPFYRDQRGRVVSIPADTKGWPTKAEAEREANEMRRGRNA